MSETPVRTPRWIKITLFVSIALNLIVIGLIGGTILRGPFAMPLVGPAGEFGVFQRAMPGEARNALRKALYDNRADFRSKRRELVAMRVELIEVLRTEPFDAARLDDIMSRQKAFWEELGSTAQHLMGEQIAAMTPDERAQFADNLEEWMKRPPRSRDARERP